MTDVDVLVPIRNPNEGWLIESLSSIQDQSGVNVRLVAVVHPESSQFVPHIRQIGVPHIIVEAPAAGYLPDALNAGLRACTAPFIARLDADDVAVPTRLARQLDLLDRDPTCAVVGSNAFLISADGNQIGLRLMPATSQRIVKRMRWRSALIHPSATFRRSVIDDLGGYSTACRGVEDYELWLRVLQHANIRSITEPLIRYRLHATQVTRTDGIGRAASDAAVYAGLHRAYFAGFSGASWRSLFRR